ncbi:uncharacterized protein F5147DRAFT_545882, partial [Suillus discolor]
TSEMEEAICAMFRLDRNAHFCIAYPHQLLTPSGFIVDEWFMRAWTLQKLLAPHTNDERNNEHDVELDDRISLITKIPSDDLQSFTPISSRMHEKMVQASTRGRGVMRMLLSSSVFDLRIIIIDYSEGKWVF